MLSIRKPSNTFDTWGVAENQRNKWSSILSQCRADVVLDAIHCARRVALCGTGSYYNVCGDAYASEDTFARNEQGWYIRAEFRKINIAFILHCVAYFHCRCVSNADISARDAGNI